jgi:hypothetical protein
VELDFAKVWLGGAAVAVGAIAGAWVWAQRAAALARRAAQAAGDDSLFEVARTTGVNTLAAAVHGAIGGAILGAVVAAAYFYFSNPDRAMPFRRVRSDDTC